MTDVHAAIDRAIDRQVLTREIVIKAAFWRLSGETPEAAAELAAAVDDLLAFERDHPDVSPPAAGDLEALLQTRSTPWPVPPPAIFESNAGSAVGPEQLRPGTFERANPDVSPPARATGSVPDVAHTAPPGPADPPTSKGQKP